MVRVCTYTYLYTNAYISTASTHPGNSRWQHKSADQGVPSPILSSLEDPTLSKANSHPLALFRRASSNQDRARRPVLSVLLEMKIMSDRYSERRVHDG
jgi:hypothetical protein